MENLALNFETIEKIKMEATKMIKEIILYVPAQGGIIQMIRT